MAGNGSTDNGGAVVEEDGVGAALMGWGVAWVN